jgi:hypothetical protein
MCETFVDVVIGSVVLIGLAWVGAGLMLLIRALCQAIATVLDARRAWRTHHPGIPYRHRRAHLEGACLHEDPQWSRWIQWCQTTGEDPWT